MSRPRPARVPARALRLHRLLLVLGVALAVGVLAGVGFAVQTARQAPAWLDLARKSKQAGDLPAAERFYEQYLEYRKNDADVRFELAGVLDEHAQASLARPREAFKLWEQSLAEAYKGLQADGRRHDERRKLAKLNLLLGRPTAARTELDVMLKEPELRADPELLDLLASTEPGTPAGKEAAANHLRAAVATGKAAPDVSARLAAVLRQDVGTPRAKQEADEVMAALVKARPDDLAARLARARYLADSDRRLQAAEDIRHAYDRIPGGRQNVDVILAHADAVAADDLAAARRILADGVKEHPADSLLGMGLAEVERRAHDDAAARRQLLAVLDALPPDDPLALDVGDRLLDLNDPAAARAADRLAAVPALAPLADYLRGRGKLLAGDWPAALPLLRSAVLAVGVSRQVKRPKPLLHKAYLALAAGYERANDPTRQVDSLKRAADLDPADLSARLALAAALAHANRPADAEAQLAAVSAGSPQARAALANLKLAAALADKRLPDFWAHVGKPPYPPELAPAVAAALAAEGRVADAEKELNAALDRAPSAAAFVMLAGLKAASPADALAVLDRAETKLGPTADVRIARATVLLRQPKPDAAAVAAVASDNLSPADRSRVRQTVGELLLLNGFPAHGLPLLKEVAAEHKYDLGVRITLFDWALTNTNPDLRDEATAVRDATLADLRRLDVDPDGGKGGMVLVAEVMHELAGTPKPDAATARRLAGTLGEAAKKRPGWSRVPRMQGILAVADGRPDDARGHFEQAVRLGDRSDPLVREAVRLAAAAGRYADALRVLESVRAAGSLPPDLERQYQVLSATASDDPAKGLARVTGAELAGSKDAADHLLRARVFARLGKPDDALRAVGKALELAPANADAMVLKVRLLAAAGTPAEKVRPEIEKAAAELRAKPPHDPAAVPLAVGQMWEAVGDTEKAAAEYQAALAAAPAGNDAPQLLLSLYRRAKDGTAADALLAKLSAAERGEVRRWARRAKAESLPAADAEKLLDENIAEANQPEDVRAKGFALCGDPRRRADGLRLIEDGRAVGRLPAADAYRLALVLIEGARFEAAERELSAATADGLLADPAPLAALAQVQAARGRFAAADRTVDRLKAVAPNRPETLLEEARRLARTDPARAAEVVLKMPADAPDAGKPLQRAKRLEAVGCTDAAEKQYAEYAAGTDPAPARLAAQVEFLARAGKGGKALAAARERLADTAIPPELLARLMVLAVRGSTDVKAVAEVVELVDDRARANPTAGEWALRKAELADGRGDPAAAAELYAAAAPLFQDRSPGRIAARNNAVALAVAATKEGTADLLAQADEVLAAVGPRPFALDTRGTVLLGLNRPKDALPDLESAAGFQASPTNLLHLAVCLKRLDRPADAKDAFERAKLLGLKRAGLPPFDRDAFEELEK